MGYECPRCHYATANKYNYINHLNKKNVCNVVFEDIDVKDLLSELVNKEASPKTFNCTHCLKRFAFASGLCRHMKTHTEINNSHNTTNSHNTETHTNSHNTNTTNNYNQPITINQTINVFGKEDLTKVLNDKEFLTKCLKDVLRDGIPNLIEKIYLNPNIPENHNIRLKTAKYPPQVEVVIGTNDDGKPIVEMKDAFELYEYIIKNKGTSLLVIHKDDLYREISKPTTDESETYGQRGKKLADINSKKKGVYGTVRNGVHAKFRTAQLRERVANTEK